LHNDIENVDGHWWTRWLSVRGLDIFQSNWRLHMHRSRCEFWTAVDRSLCNCTSTGTLQIRFLREFIH